MYIDPKTSELEMLYLKRGIAISSNSSWKTYFFRYSIFFLYRETSFNYSETTLVQSDFWLQWLHCKYQRHTNWVASVWCFIYIDRRKLVMYIVVHMVYD